MKITNVKMIEYLSFFEEIKSFYLPQKIAYAITKNAKMLAKEYEEMYLPRINAMIENAKKNNWLVLDEDGVEKYDSNGSPIVKKDFAKNFNNEANELLLYEIDFDKWLTVEEEAFNYNDEKYTALTPQQLGLLMDILQQ